MRWRAGRCRALAVSCCCESAARHRASEKRTSALVGWRTGPPSAVD